MLDRFGQYGRSAAWLGFFGLILWAWYVLYAMAGSMGMDVFGRMAAMPDMMSMPMGSETETGNGMSGMSGMGGEPAMGMTSVAVLIPMWVIMMAAMMGPTFVPTARTYEDLIRTGAGTRAGFLGVIAGYLAVWFGFGAAIGLAHVWFLSQGLLTEMGASASRWFSVALLGIAGLYQFTATKDRCLEHCRSPMVHFLGYWRPGPIGGAKMGARIGLWCIGCCWAIMSIGFVGGAMNLVWMGIATLIMTLEKLPDIGRWLTRPLGAVFLGAAALAAAGLI